MVGDRFRWLDDAVRREFWEAGHLSDETWYDFARCNAVENPAATAVVDETGRLTRADVTAQATRLAAYLRLQGVGAGDVVTLVVPNWREFVVIHEAIGMTGGVVNPLLPRMGPRDMGHILSTARSAFVFAAQEHRGSSPLEVVRSASKDLSGIRGIITVRGTSGTSLADVLGEPWEERVAVERPAVDPAGPDTVTFTSGTEALPKGVVHSHHSTVFGLRAYIGQTLGLTADDPIFMPSPICHASGLQWGLRAAIFTGSLLVLQDRWDPETALRLIDEHRCTYTLGATPFIVDLLAAQRAHGGGGRTLRYVASGGAPIPRHLVSEVRTALGAELMAVFGASETYITTATRPGDPDAMLASDGAPLPGVQVEIVDPDGNPVPQGDEGEIVTRGPQVFLGYLGDPDLTRRAFRGSWFRFGDLGVIDENGMLHVTGRIKDIVIRGGENISVREIEELLVRLPQVEAAAVVGYPDDRLGERCCAVVVPADAQPVELSEINAYLLGQGLARFKLPERLMSVPELPMTATGKVRKAVLRQLVAEGAATHRV